MGKLFQIKAGFLSKMRKNQRVLQKRRQFITAS